MAPAQPKAQPWVITTPDHGVFLCHGSYCVARLDDKSPTALYASIASAPTLQAENERLREALNGLEPLLTQLAAEFHNGKVNGAHIPGITGDLRSIAAELTRAWEPVRAALTRGAP